MKKTLKHKLITLLFISLSIILCVVFLIACGPTAPSKEQCEQAITDYIKANLTLSEYRGFHDIMVTEVGESITLGEPPNEFPAWPVEATIYRYNRPALDDKVFVVAKDVFGSWCVPGLYQSFIDFTG